MLFYDVFYRRTGVRIPDQLMMPTMPLAEKFLFPKNSIYHFVPTDPLVKGPPQDDYLFRDNTKKIFVEHVLALSTDLGNPKREPVPLEPQARAFHIQNKKFRQTTNLASTTNDDNTLIVVNYGLLGKAYRYVRSIYGEYYRVQNIQNTMWDKVIEVAKESPRHQFIFATLPQTLPSINRLDLASKGISQALVPFFSTPESLTILELWKWLSPEFRATSKIGEQDYDTLKKINIVYQESGRWIMINLGLLDSWRNDPAHPRDGQKIKIDAKSLQKRTLRSLMCLMESRTVGKDLSEDGLLESSSVTSDNGETSDMLPSSVAEKKPAATGGNVYEVDEEAIPIEDMSKAAQIEKMLESLDDDLNQLEELEIEVDTKEEAADSKENPQGTPTNKVVEVASFDVTTTPEDKLKALCGNLADGGLLSAAEYRRVLKQVDSIGDIKSPDGKTTLKEYATILESDVKIVESPQIKDMGAVIDKSMLKSSLIAFDEQYITKVLRKDIANSVIGAQKAGFIITRYEIENVEDILGKYDIHTVRVTPIEGVPSTLRFKLPSVNKDGTYSNGNVKYRMRKQRAD